MSDFKSKGNDAFKLGKYQEAISWYSKAIAADPKNETLYSNRAASYSAINDHAQALADAEQCCILKPAWVKGHFRKGVALVKLGKYDEAVKSYSKALEIEPANEDIQAKFNEARTMMKKQVDGRSPLRVNDAMECKRMGNTQFKEGKYDDAKEWYSRAIELTENNPKADQSELAIFYTNRAFCHAQGHMYKQVVADSTSAIAIDPKFAKAYLRRAMANEALEKWQKAADDYRTVMELEPGSQAATEGFRRAQKFAKDMM
jgi:Tfp pilus assembly protein PilF